MSNRDSPLMRLFQFGQNKLRSRRRKSKPPPSLDPSIQDQVRCNVRERRRSSARSASVPIPSDVARSIHEDSNNAGAPAAPTLLEDCWEQPQCDGSAVESTNADISPAEDEHQEEPAIPTIVITVPESDSEHSEPSRAGRRLPTSPVMDSGLRVQRPRLRRDRDSRNNPDSLRRRFWRTSDIDELPRDNSRQTRSRIRPGAPRSTPRERTVRSRRDVPPPTAREQPTVSLPAPRHNGRERLAFTLSAAGNVLMESSNPASRATHRAVETGPADSAPESIPVRRPDPDARREGTPAVLHIDSYEYLVRLECIIENSADLFPGLDSRGESDVCVDTFGSLTPGFHRTVAFGAELWLVRLITQLVRSDDSTTRLRTPPTGRVQAPGTAQTGGRLQDTARTANSGSSGETVRQPQPPTTDDIRRVNNASTIRAREAPARSIADIDTRRVDPQPAPHDQTPPAADVQTSPVESRGLQPSTSSPDARYSLAPGQAFAPGQMQGTPLPHIQALSQTRPPQQVPGVGHHHNQNDVPVHVQESPANHYHAHNDDIPTTSGPPLHRLVIPLRIQESPRPQYARVLTESPVSLSQEEVNLVSTPARHPDPAQGPPASPTERTAQQALQLPWPPRNTLGLTPPGSPDSVHGPPTTVANPSLEAQWPPLVPPGLMLAMNRNPAQEAPAPNAAHASPQWARQPQLVSDATSQNSAQGQRIISPPNLPIQRPLWMGDLIPLTPAGYPDPCTVIAHPAVTPSYSPPREPPPTPHLTPADKVPSVKALHKTIRRPQPSPSSTLQAGPSSAWKPNESGHWEEYTNGVERSKRIPAAAKEKWPALPSIDSVDLQTTLDPPPPPGPSLLFWDMSEDWAAARSSRITLTSTVGCPPLPPRPHGGARVCYY
ncbi:hypothetical protein L208DRAFT_1461012 [Tricholoma matsutake]|nr:hypothetical protein L208DRAFT_1461012 [Tricholoma matsutake 945]